MTKQVDLNLVPENIKNIAARANPDNRHTTAMEKMVAEAQLESITQYCMQVLTQVKIKAKR